MSTANDYKDIMIKLAPSGACWPTEDSSVWVTLLLALAQEPARIDASDLLLVSEAFPDTTSQLLPNWERVLGLPDAFSDPAATETERRNTVLAKMKARGGQSADYYQTLIETLGYANSISECYPFMADVGMADDYLFDDTWIYHFIVRVFDPVPDHALFEARIRSLQPAHAISIFIYS